MLRNASFAGEKKDQHDQSCDLTAREIGLESTVDVVDEYVRSTIQLHSVRFLGQ